MEGMVNGSDVPGVSVPDEKMLAATMERTIDAILRAMPNVTGGLSLPGDFGAKEVCVALLGRTDAIGGALKLPYVNVMILAAQLTAVLEVFEGLIDALNEGRPEADRFDFKGSIIDAKCRALQALQAQMNAQVLDRPRVIIPRA